MPLLYKTESPRIGIWKMDESAEELRAMLPEATWEELLALDGNPRLSSDARQKEWMTSRLLVKELIGQTCGITHDTSGAPRLADSSLHISISHTRGYAAIILSDMQRTGIDIEYTSDRVRKIRSRFLSPEEESFIDPQTDTQQLLICWCAKETLYKYARRRGLDLCRDLRLLEADPVRGRLVGRVGDGAPLPMRIDRVEGALVVSLFGNPEAPLSVERLLF